MALLAVALYLMQMMLGCTVIAFNKGDVTTSEKDSHDAEGTNNARTVDVNIDPR